MSKLDKDAVLENFTKAYTKANGKAPTIEAKGGWYSVDGGKNVRLAQLEELTAELSAGSAAPDAEEKAPAAKKKASKTTIDTKEAKAPKKAAIAKKSAPATKKSKAAKSFSVRDFYIKQIMEENAGAKAPR